MDSGTPAFLPVWQSCGPHRFYLRDDVLYWEGHGSMSPHDIAVLFEHRIALHRQYGRAFVLVDARALGGISAESRNYVVRNKAALSITGRAVVFGAGLVTRTAVALISGAARLLGLRMEGSALFVGDEVEAWELIARERRLLDAERPSG